MTKAKFVFTFLRAALVLVYAILLLWLIPVFFMNYNGDWYKKVAEKFPLREKPTEQSPTSNNE